MRLAGMLNLDADGLWALLQRERVERMVGREQAEGAEAHDHDALDLLMVGNSCRVMTALYCVLRVGCWRSLTLTRSPQASQYFWYD